jgi:ABC-type sugar transport system ATPase subunit
LNLSLAKGELGLLAGRSGCGKSTLLNIICGLAYPMSGEVLFEGSALDPRPEKRGVGIVFQRNSLFAHMKVKDNISYGLFDWNKKEQLDRVQELAGLLGIESLLERYPHEISGGQGARVSLARAMAPRPQILLFDEAFSSLDPLMAQEVRSDIYELLRKFNQTSLFITHRPKEMMNSMDLVGLLEEGKLSFWLSPSDVCEEKLSPEGRRFFLEELS